MGNFIAKRHVYIEDDKVWVHTPTDVITGPNYMNALYLPTNALSETDFAYLSVDGSSDQPYVDSFPGGPLTYGGDTVTYGGDIVTYGV